MTNTVSCFPWSESWFIHDLKKCLPKIRIQIILSSKNSVWVKTERRWISSPCNLVTQVVSLDKHHTSIHSEGFYVSLFSDKTENVKDMYSSTQGHAQLFSCVQLFETPWTTTCQAPLSMGFSRQEYWSGLPCPSPEDCTHPRIEFTSPALAGRFFTSELPGRPMCIRHSGLNQINHFTASSWVKLAFFKNYMWCSLHLC